MIKLIIFDFDGTLGDTRANIVKTMQDTMRTLDLPMRGEAEIAATIGLPLEKGFGQLFPGLSGEEYAHCAATYREIFNKNLKILTPGLFPGVKDTLERLAASGRMLTVASSRSSASLNGLLRDMGISGFVSYVLGADNVSKAKPDPEPVLKTLRELGFNAGDSLVVGDMPVDIMMGARAGAHTCAVTWGNASREALEASGAEHIIDSMPELFNVLDLH